MGSGAINHDVRVSWISDINVFVDISRFFWLDSIVNLLMLLTAEGIDYILSNVLR